MVKQLRRVGNSSAITLDKALLELVGLHERGFVQVAVHDGSLILTPVRPRRASRERFEASLERVVKERREVLRRLAQ
jgi:antitoxin component of MazEF toxin-antitoxin module